MTPPFIRPARLGALLLLALPALARAQDPGTRQAAIDAFVGGDLGRAKRLSLSWLEGHPKDGEILRLLGMVRITSGMEMEKRERPRTEFLPVYHRALEALLQAERIEGRRGDVDHAVGYILLADRKYAEAVERLSRALEAAPRSFVLHRLRGSAYLGLGKYAEAEADLARAERLNPKDFATRIFHAEALSLLSREEEARTTLQEYYGLIEKERPDERHWRTLYEIHRYAMVLNDLEGALPPLERAVRMDPSALASRVDLGILYYQLGRSAEAASELDAVLAAASAPPGIRADALHYKGLLAQREGRHEAARRLFEGALALAPNRAETLKGLGASLQRSGEGEKAREVLERFRQVVEMENDLRVLRSELAMEPMKRGSRLDLVGLLLRLGRSREAAQELERFRERHPEDPALAELEARVSEALASHAR